MRKDAFLALEFTIEFCVCNVVGRTEDILSFDEFDLIKKIGLKMKSMCKYSPCANAFPVKAMSVSCYCPLNVEFLSS